MNKEADMRVCVEEVDLLRGLVLRELVYSREQDGDRTRFLRILREKLEYLLRERF